MTYKNIYKIKQMGRIENTNNNVTTKYVTGEVFNGISAEANTYFLGVDSDGLFKKLSPNGDITNLEVAYTKYVFFLSQTGAADPTAIVLENTISPGNDITWSRPGVGNYTGTLNGVFTTDKTFIMVNQNSYNNSIVSAVASLDSISISTYINGVGLSDDILSNTPIEIRVYP